MCRKQLELTVRKSSGDWAYKDLIGINAAHRFEAHRGDIYRITSNGRSKRVIVRGNDEHDATCMDLVLREFFFDNVEMVGKKQEFTMTRSWQLWGMLCFAWNHSDPAYKLSARLGVISLLLGLISSIPSLV